MSKSKDPRLRPPVSDRAPGAAVRRAGAARAGAERRGEAGSASGGGHCHVFPAVVAAAVRKEEVPRLDKRSVCGPFSKPSGHTLLASSKKDAAAQREAQEGDVQGQEGAEASHAGGPAADHHGGAAHAGRGRAPDRGVCVRGHAPHRHRVSATAGVDSTGRERRCGRGSKREKRLSRAEMLVMLSSEQEHPVFSSL
ncbi:PREDICTED: single-pass membrane and coiled-coil domain-containing protein 4 [Propithecus coquereli]|uniref:single-pass membrane and coiled-coil domain-containing protein 4 n=1 Tax=Propithecus coquereli TaxID=379532 RepID=UPI00063F3416|nr:PREDICTED: single-pass membrane and coiled-coil domain-containing protein 4 [Propithecus coquereli]